MWVGIRREVDAGGRRVVVYSANDNAERPSPNPADCRTRSAACEGRSLPERKNVQFSLYIFTL